MEIDIGSSFRKKHYWNWKNLNVIKSVVYADLGIYVHGLFHFSCRKFLIYSRLLNGPFIDIVKV